MCWFCHPYDSAVCGEHLKANGAYHLSALGKTHGHSVLGLTL